MNITQQLNFSFKKKLSVIYQNEISDCGLACIAMVLNYYGYNVELRDIKKNYPDSSSGMSLRKLMSVSSDFKLCTRPVKLSTQDLNSIKLPCILHWDNNHYVVLKEIRNIDYIIHDPGKGVVTLKVDEFNKSFSKVALELWPSNDFTKKKRNSTISLSELFGKIIGLKSSLLIVLFLSFCMEIFSLIQPMFLQWVIDDVILTYDLNLMNLLVILFSIFVILYQVISFIRSWSLMYFGTSLNVQWKSNVFLHLIKLPVAFFQRRSLGDLVSRFGAVDIIQQTLTASFLSAVIDGIIAIVTLIVMFFYSIKLSIVALITILTYSLLRLLWFKPLVNANNDYISNDANQNNQFLESIKGIKSIELFNKQQVFFNKWQMIFIKQVNSSLRIQKLQLIYQNINGLLFSIEGIIIIWLGALMVINGSLSVGALMAFNIYKLSFDSRICQLIDNFFEFRLLRLQNERLSDIVLTKIDSKNSHSQIHSIINSDDFTIEFKNVAFSFNNDHRYIFSDVNLSIKSGESVVITGPSGCGKTTFLNLILAIYSPSQGQVLIKDTNHSASDIINLREYIGSVTQDDVLFTGSAMENITFFEENPDKERVYECARAANIHADIIAMPMGYSTIIGNTGHAVSGGQAQRILLARAIYKKPKILILDEAFSSLDLNNEIVINESIKGMKITKIFVAHRKETINSAIRVLEFSNNTIIEKSMGENGC